MSNKMRVIVMGCGGSGGVPYAGNVWGDCDPTNPKNARMRPSLLIEKNGTRIVIDTGPDFRIQINQTGITEDQLLDGVLYTHTHVDHIMGTDDLRTFWYRAGKKPVQAYGSKTTIEELKGYFQHCFEQTSDEYPITIQGNYLPENHFKIGSLEIDHFEQFHGHIKTTGYRFGDFAYSTDVHELPPESLEKLKGVKTWIIGCFHTDEGSFNHAGYNKIKEWQSIINPEIIYLTHLSARSDYDSVCKILPDNIRPAYDGLELFI